MRRYKVKEKNIKKLIAFLAKIENKKNGNNQADLGQRTYK